MSLDENDAPKKLTVPALVGLLFFALSLFSAFYWAVTEFLEIDRRSPIVFGVALAFFMLPLHDVLKRQPRKPFRDKAPPDDP